VPVRSAAAGPGPTPARAEDRPDLDVLSDPARVAAVERLLASGVSGRSVQTLTLLAARLLDAPCAQVSMLGEREQVVAAAVGVPWQEGAPPTPAEQSLCSVTAALGRAFAVEDAAGHPWVYDLPPVTSGQVSAYLGVVLTDVAGHVLGSLCVYGSEPRGWSDGDCDTLTVLAEAVAEELEHGATQG
jgi:GAF domain-containing protein